MGTSFGCSYGSWSSFYAELNEKGIEFAPSYYYKDDPSSTYYKTSDVSKFLREVDRSILSENALFVLKCLQREPDKAILDGEDIMEWN